jgi:hypothetical protein
MSGVRLPPRVVFILLLGFASGPLFAQGILPGDRWPVRGTPRIWRREIPQFILLEEVWVDQARPKPGFTASTLLRAIPKNLFTPVSEDKEGVFYHAANGMWEIDTTYSGPGIAGTAFPAGFT